MAEQLAIWLALPEVMRSPQAPRTYSRMVRGPSGNQLAFWSAIDHGADLEEEGGEVAPPPPPVMQPKHKSAKALRTCLGPCGRVFQSRGPGHRICPRCRRLDAYADGAPEYSVQF